MESDLIVHHSLIENYPLLIVLFLVFIAEFEHSLRVAFRLQDLVSLTLASKEIDALSVCSNKYNIVGI